MINVLVAIAMLYNAAVLFVNYRKTRNRRTLCFSISCLCISISQAVLFLHGNLSRQIVIGLELIFIIIAMASAYFALTMANKK